MKYEVGPTDDSWPQVTYACVGNLEATIAQRAADNYWNIDVVALSSSSDSFIEDRAVFVERLKNKPMINGADSIVYGGLGWLLKVTSEAPDSESVNQFRVGGYISATRFLAEVATTAYNLTTRETDTLLPATIRPESISSKKAIISLKPNFEGANDNLADGKTKGIDALLKRA